MRRPLAVTTLLLALLLAACGGDDGAQVALSEPAVTEPATEEPTSAPEPTEEPAVAEEPAAPAPTTAPDPDDADADADTSDEAAEGDDADDADDPAATTFELSLNGDGVEGGCSWGVDEDERFYEIVYPDGMAVVGSPVSLVDADGDVIATEGGGMRVTGTLAPDQTPSCDVGTVLLADSVEPL